MTSEQTWTEEAIRRWLIEAVATVTRLDVSIVTAESAFIDLGLSSIAAVALTLRVSEAFGIEIDPMLTWDYPTIGETARAISEQIGRAA